MRGRWLFILCEKFDEKMKLPEAIKRVKDIHYYVVNVYNEISLDEQDIEAIETMIQEVEKHSTDDIPLFSVSLVYHSSNKTMLLSCTFRSNNENEALGEAIEYFKEESKGLSLALKTVVLVDVEL